MYVETIIKEIDHDHPVTIPFHGCVSASRRSHFFAIDYDCDRLVDD
jgi:hypothetical protein